MFLPVALGRMDNPHKGDWPGCSVLAESEFIQGRSRPRLLGWRQHAAVRLSGYGPDQRRPGWIVASGTPPAPIREP
jgi:hypothetical protein